MKSKYKYFGSGEILTFLIHFKKFGQELALTDVEALDIATIGGILRSDDFDAINWTPMEKKNRHERKGPAYLERHLQAVSKNKELVKELTEKLAIAE